MADPLVDRFRAAFAALLAELFPERKFLGLHRYSVTACDFDAQTFDGQPSVSKYGLPAVAKVPIRSNIKVELKPGCSVILGFESGNPGSPFLAFVDQLLLMGKATLRADGHIEIGEGATQPVGRQGDMVLIPSLGLNIMFATQPTGDQVPTPLMTMVPYFVSLCTATSVPPIPVFPPIGNWPGIVSSGSPNVKTT